MKRMTKREIANRDETLRAIAQQCFHDPETFVERNLDEFDFLTVSVRSIRRALDLAYQAGRVAPRISDR